jgi:hypothetical protein
MSIGGDPGQQIDQEIGRTAMAGVLDPGDILELIVDVKISTVSPSLRHLASLSGIGGTEPPIVFSFEGVSDSNGQLPIR